MDSEKRQKVMLVAAAVLCVGAGSYWLFGRDSDEKRPVALVQGGALRKPHAATETPSPPRKPNLTLPSDDGTAEVQRKPPPEAVNTHTTRKPSSRPGKSDTKKKPATAS